MRTASQLWTMMNNLEQTGNALANTRTISNSYICSNLDVCLLSPTSPNFLAPSSSSYCPSQEILGWRVPGPDVCLPSSTSRPPSLSHSLPGSSTAGEQQIFIPFFKIDKNTFFCHVKSSGSDGNQRPLCLLKNKKKRNLPHSLHPSLVLLISFCIWTFLSTHPAPLVFASVSSQCLRTSRSPKSGAALYPFVQSRYSTPQSYQLADWPQYCGNAFVKVIFENISKEIRWYQRVTLTDVKVVCKKALQNKESLLLVFNKTKMG